MGKVARMRVLVAVIGKPFGVRGEVTIRSHSDELESRLEPGTEVFLSETGSDSLLLDSARFSPGGGVLALAGIDAREAAEDLRGADLWVQIAEQARPDADDEWYAHQLVGLPCLNTAGETLGKVVAVQAHPAHDTLIVQTGSTEVMVPFVQAIVPEVGDDGVVVADPGGLFPTD
ncbi:MAG: ribosome maturation factor RimM [Actinomycetia bacterium]|nr:ribosome maturation factor RimM [Actinomycetes bacterium]